MVTFDHTHFYAHSEFPYLIFWSDFLSSVCIYLSVLIIRSYPSELQNSTPKREVIIRNLSYFKNYFSIVLKNTPSVSEKDTSRPSFLKILPGFL